jgi:hypothetical protein
MAGLLKDHRTTAGELNQTAGKEVIKQLLKIEPAFSSTEYLNIVNLKH